MPIPITAPPRAPTSRADALRAIDWRTVAAVGLPIWAFVFGVVVARPGAASKLAPEVLAQNEVPTPPATSPALVVAEAPHPWPVVVRHEVIGVPVAVPVLTPAAERVAALPMPPAGDEFRLPASELMPAERCPTFGTKLKFHPGLPEAAEEARLSKKMVLVLHISGHFDDPGFT